MVCFGGVSLAVYMHGVSKEFLKLVRASKALHAVANRAERAESTFVPNHPQESDTEAVYYDLLRTIGTQVELRVVIDIVAGASAGGINGVLLARALAHDLPIDSLRELWLRQADVTELLAEDSRATRYSKIILEPFIWLASKTGLIRLARDEEVRRKMSLFVRSRWFKPPFGGLRMSEMLHEALRGMGHADRAGSSLVPAGQPLELFIPITDFYGAQHDIPLHDPPTVSERDHRHTLRFVYDRDHDGNCISDFDDAGVPALTFAARATSSFPGAFPPAQLGEIDRLLAIRGDRWVNRQRFLERNFPAYLDGDMDPGATSFIDGSVLNNKPFARALQSIDGRPAFRQVDRRLVYIDPDPRRPPPPPSGRAPGFFSTLKGALSDIPRNEPIGQELRRVNDHNATVRRQRAVVEGARPYVERLVREVGGADTGGMLAPDHIGLWRDAAHELAITEAGYAYEGYARQNLASIAGELGSLLLRLAGHRTDPAQREWFTRLILRWARLRGAYAAESITLSHRADGPAERWRWFLQTFDLGFRKRRLRFLIQNQNQLYQQVDREGESELSSELIDWLKRRYYDHLDSIRRRERTQYFPPELRARAAEMFAENPPSIRPSAFALLHYEALTELLESIGVILNLQGESGALDELMATLDPAAWTQTIRHDILLNYIGFTFWDVMTFSITAWRDLSEFNEIKIDRISPDEARALRPSDGRPILRGATLAHFGAFFSRVYRENDYLWGRLNAVDRLIDIIADAAGPALPGGADAVATWKRRAFKLVLETEKPQLPQVATLIDELDAELNARMRTKP